MDIIHFDKPTHHIWRRNKKLGQIGLTIWQINKWSKVNTVNKFPFHVGKKNPKLTNIPKFFFSPHLWGSLGPRGHRHRGTPGRCGSHGRGMASAISDLGEPLWCSRCFFFLFWELSKLFCLFACLFVKQLDLSCFWEAENPTCWFWIPGFGFQFWCVKPTCSCFFGPGPRTILQFETWNHNTNKIISLPVNPS